MATEDVCPKCGGTGFVIIERADVSGAQPCDCRKENLGVRRLDDANIPLLYCGASFENFAHFNSPLKQAMETARSFASKFRELSASERPGLLLIGEPGTGKTHLAIAALRRILEQGFECLFCDYQNLLDRIRASYDPNSNSADREAYRDALETEVLLLDDLGAHRVTDWVEDTITSIITYRCNHRKPLIVTTNLPDADAGSATYEKTAVGTQYRTTLRERIGDRARSRLFEMCTVIRMPLVEDYRLRKKQVRVF